MKLGKLFSMMLLATMFAFTSCNDDDDDNNGGGGATLVEDGMYIIGEATPWSEATFNAQMVTGINENGGVSRSSMYEKYLTLEAGKTFQIVEVAGASQIIYGPGNMVETDFTATSETTPYTEHPQVTIKSGNYVNEGSFTVETSGLYQIVLDTELGKVFIVPVNYWGVLGAASDFGWSDNDTHMMPGTFDKNTMTFSISNVILRTGKAFKVRHDGGWKIGLETFNSTDSVRVNTNFGGAIDALVPGGADIMLEQAEGKDGTYTISMTWSAENGGYGFNEIVLSDFSEVEPLPDYVDLYLVGDATAYGWDQPSTHESAIMHQCANSQDGLYWKVLFLESGKGFKVSAANWGTPNIGFAEVTTFDPEGVTVTNADGNMGVAESGMYVVAADLRTDGEIKISVKPAQIFGIGDAFGGWNEATYPFTVDNTAKTFTIDVAADGNIRMYALVPWNSAGSWWAAEFNVFDGIIEYRNNGGDQAAVPGTAGQTITLSFDDNTGSIE